MISRSSASIAVSLAFFVSPATGEAITLRYALVVGSNIGVDADAGPLPRLEHAEREAAALRDGLVRLASFDASGDRTLLLLGPSRGELERGVDSLAARIEADRREIEGAHILFAFFFTGHGLNERLLLRDGSVAARDLTRWLERVKFFVCAELRYFS